MSNLETVVNTYLPKKYEEQTNTTKDYNRFNNYCLIFGKNLNEYCYKTNVGEDIYIKVRKYLESKTEYWDRIIQNSCKHFYYNDLQLIINEYGDLWCKKDKVFSYSILKNTSTNKNSLDTKINLYRSNKIPIDLFPPSITYHDMRKVNKIRFIKNNISHELLIINHKNKELTYNVKIYGNISKLKQIITSYIQIYDIISKDSTNLEVYIDNKIIKNYDISKLAISIM